MQFLVVLWGALGSFGAPLGILWEPFGAIWGVFGDPWGSLGDPLGLPGGLWGGPRGVASLLGRFWDGFWDHFGTMLAPFWGRFLSENRPSFLDRCWSRFGSHFS